MSLNHHLHNLIHSFLFDLANQSSPRRNDEMPKSNNSSKAPSLRPESEQLLSPKERITASSVISTWKQTSAPRNMNNEIIKPNSAESRRRSSGNLSGRIVVDAPCPIYLMDGSKRTLILTAETSGKDICIEILTRWKMESHVNDVMLCSYVKDKIEIVETASPLGVKTRWPLIVSSNKNDIPKCRFVVRCRMGASASMQKLLGPPVPRDGLKVI